VPNKIANGAVHDVVYIHTYIHTYITKLFFHLYHVIGSFGARIYINVRDIGLPQPCKLDLRFLGCYAA